MTLWIISISFLILYTLINIWLNSRQQKRHNEMLESYKVQIQTKANLIEAINASRMDRSEIKLLKAYVRTLLQQMEQHEQKLDEAINVFTTKVVIDGDNLDLDKLTEEMQRQGVIVADHVASIERIVPKGYWEEKRK